MMRKKILNQYGVTLIETIVSLGVLTMGIISALTLITSTIVYSQTSEQKIVVVNLAREGLEMARAVRETEGFSALNSGSKIVGVNYVSGDIEIDTADNENISNCQNCALYLYEGRYLHNVPGDTSNIKRLVTITDVGVDEKRIVSTVQWIERGRIHSFILEEDITNW